LGAAGKEVYATLLTIILNLSQKSHAVAKNLWYTNSMIKKKLLKYTVIYTEEPEEGFTVTVPSLPGCVTYGKNLKEAEKMAKEAIELYLESLKAHEETIPEGNKSFIGSVDLEFPYANA